MTTYPDDLTAEEFIAVQAEEIAELRTRLDSIVEKHAAELGKVKAEHEAHLARIEHGDCISTAAHKLITADLRRKAGA